MINRTMRTTIGSVAEVQLTQRTQEGIGKVSRFLPGYVVTTEACAGGIGGFYREVVSSIKFLSVRFSNDYLRSARRKELYFALCDVFPVPLYRAMHRGGPESNVLKRVKKMHVQPASKTFFFKLHSGTLPVKVFLEAKGGFSPWASHCIFCKAPETIDHVLLHCWKGVYILDVLQRAIKKDLPLDPYGIRFLNVENEDGVPYDAMMLLGLHSLWKARMAGYHFDKDARPTRAYFCESIDKFLSVDKPVPKPPDWLQREDDLVTLPEF